MDVCLCTDVVRRTQNIEFRGIAIPVSEDWEACRAGLERVALEEAFQEPPF